MRDERHLAKPLSREAIAKAHGISMTAVNTSKLHRRVTRVRKHANTLLKMLRKKHTDIELQIQMIRVADAAMHAQKACYERIE